MSTKRKRLLQAVVLVNLILGIGFLSFAVLCGLFPTAVLGQTEGGAAKASDAVVQWGFLGASLATGLACIGAGIAVGPVGAATIGAITEKPELLGRSLILVGLAEGISIYGLVIAIMILGRI